MIKIIKWILAVLLIIILIALGINLFVIIASKENIITEEAANIANIDCIIILGAGVRGDKPSPMLEDRLLQGIELYKKGIAKKIIMSGDHGRVNYDEVNVMKKYAIEHGVPSEDIFMDHAGFSSYESMYRAKEIFGANRVIVVTQKYHLYRTLYIAKKLGIEAWRSTIKPTKICRTNNKRDKRNSSKKQRLYSMHIQTKTNIFRRNNTNK